MEKIFKVINVTINEILRATQKYYNRGTNYSFREIDCYYLFYAKEGSAVFTINGEACQLKQNHMLLLHPSQAFQLAATHQPTQLISLVFTEQYQAIEQLKDHPLELNRKHQLLLQTIYSEIEKINLLKRSKPSITYDIEFGELFNLACSQLYTHLAQLLLAMLEEQTFKKLPKEIAKNIRQLYVLPSDESRYTEIAKNESQQVYKNQLVNQIITFMQENLARNYSIDELAQEFLMGSANLKKVFKKETGHSIMNYFKQLKMQKAQTLVRENELSYTEIAERLGFSSIHHFSSAFKKYSGCSPSKYFASVQPGYIETVKDVDYLLNQQHWPM